MRREIFDSVAKARRGVCLVLRIGRVKEGSSWLTERSSRPSFERWRLVRPFKGNSSICAALLGPAGAMKCLRYRTRLSKRGLRHRENRGYIGCLGAGLQLHPARKDIREEAYARSSPGRVSPDDGASTPALPGARTSSLTARIEKHRRASEARSGGTP